MKLREMAKNRSYCSVSSLSHKFDPAILELNHDFYAYLIMEFPRPWDRKVELSDQFPARLQEQITRLKDKGKKIKFICVVPDSTNSISPNTIMIQLYKNPNTFFDVFPKTEVQIPKELFEEVALALLNEDMGKYDEYVITDEFRDLFVCNHGNRDACCGKFGPEIYKTLKEASDGDLHTRIWLSSHFGGHRVSPTMVDMPQGRVYGYLTPEISRLIFQSSGDHHKLLPHYRGCMGLDRYSQILEKQIFSIEGWEWLKTKKRSEIIEETELSIKTRIHYQAWPKEGYYDGTVEYRGLFLLPTTDCSNQAELPIFEVVKFSDFPKSRKPVVVTEYNPQWPIYFISFKEMYDALLSGLIITVEHVGSTSVQDLAAKPIIDIDIVMESQHFSEIKDKLEAFGYQHQGDLGIKGREAFELIDPKKKSELFDHHLYVCDKSSIELKRHLAFRNYLRRNPKICNEYRELKLRLASTYSADIEAYLSGKNDFVSFHLKYALQEW